MIVQENLVLNKEFKGKGWVMQAESVIILK